MRINLFRQVFIFTSVFLTISILSGCINFDEWEKKTNTVTPIKPILRVISTPVSTPLFSTYNSKRLLGVLHENALSSIIYKVPNDWIVLRSDFFGSPSLALTLHIYTFPKGTSKIDVINEYKSVQSQINNILSEETALKENFIYVGNDAWMFFYTGEDKVTKNDWGGVIFTFQTNLYTYLFIWDIMDYSNPKLKEEASEIYNIIDSIRSIK